MSTVATAVYVTVRCDGCGGTRELSARQAKRPGRCPMCLRLARLGEPGPEDFLFWLERFSDFEIVAIVLRLAPASPITTEYVAGLRERMARPVRVLSSVSERAGGVPV